MNGSYEIGFAEPGDAESWMQLVELVADNFPGLVKEDYRKTLEKNIARHSAICAKLHGDVVGALLFSLKAGTLSCMAVHPGHRRRGIASEMILMMLINFPADAEISVTTFREGDPMGDAPRALYQRFGFDEAEFVDGFDGYPCQRFVRYGTISTL